LYHHQDKGAFGLQDAGWKEEVRSEGERVCRDSEEGREDPDAEMEWASALWVMEVLKW
jgi:hypothetical protein